MRHSKKKTEQTRLPEQDAMGSSDDYAPGGSTSQGDGQADGPTFTDSADTADTPISPSDTDSAADASAQQDTGAERERYLRLAAEYDNYRKRAARERTDAGARAQADLVRELIDALDDVARFAHVDPATTDAATVVQGVDMVEKKMLKALGNSGLEVINRRDVQSGGAGSGGDGADFGARRRSRRLQGLPAGIRFQGAAVASSAGRCEAVERLTTSAP